MLSRQAKYASRLARERIGAVLRPSWGQLGNAKLCFPPSVGSTFSIFIYFHDIEINLQNELVDICSAFVALKNRIFVRDMCTLIAQGLPCRALDRQHTCIFFEYMSRYMFAASGQAQMTEFS